MKTLKIHAFNIDWDVQEEDVDINDYFDTDADALDEKAFDLAVEKAVNDILKDLPEEVTFEIPVTDDFDVDDDEFLDDIVCDILSDDYGWLINSYCYEII